MDGFIENIFVDGCAQFRQCHPIWNGVDHFHDLGVMLDTPIPEVCQHTLFDDGAVEVTAGDVHAAVGIDLTLTRITQPHHCDIKRAAAKVKDDNVLRFAYGLFIIQCGGNGFQLKVHFLETSFMRGVP